MRGSLTPNLLDQYRTVVAILEQAEPEAPGSCPGKQRILNFVAVVPTSNTSGQFPAQAFIKRQPCRSLYLRCR